MKKNFKKVLALVLALAACLSLAACNSNGNDGGSKSNVSVDKIYMSEVAMAEVDNGYGSTNVHLNSFELITFTNNTYQLVRKSSVEAWEDNYTSFAITYFGNFTVADGVYTLTQPSRIIEQIYACEGMKAYAPDTYYDTDNAETYGDYQDKAELYKELIGETYVNQVTVLEDQRYITAVSETTADATAPTGSTGSVSKMISESKYAVRDNGYGGEITEIHSYSLIPNSDGSYILTSVTTMEVWEGAFSTIYYNFHGTYTEADGVYTLSKPTRVEAVSVPCEGMESFMPLSYVDSDNAETYGDNYDSKDDALAELIGETYINTATVHTATNFILETTTTAA